MKHHLMPITQAGLPFSGKTLTSKHCSYMAATEAQLQRGRKSQRYLDWLRLKGQLSDHQAADDLGWPLSSICSIRNGLFDRGLIEVAGTIEGKYGKRGWIHEANDLWPSRPILWRPKELRR
jgi:hypothetical protein